MTSELFDSDKVKTIHLTVTTNYSKCMRHLSSFKGVSVVVGWLLVLPLMPTRWATAFKPLWVSITSHHSSAVVTRHLSALHSAMSESSTTYTSQPTIPPVAPTAKRLFLVRHGEVINPGGDRPVYYGAMDVSLSPLGELEAQAAGDYLQQYKLSKVFSSPLSRAIYGAEQVLQRQTDSADKSVVILDGFKELDRGDWCGKTKAEIGSDMMARFDACDESVTPANGESYPALKQRVLQARDQALEQMEPGDMACVVSHLQVTRSILSEALEIPTSEMANLKVATASVTCIDYEGDTQTVHFQSFKPDVGLEKSKDGAN